MSVWLDTETKAMLQKAPPDKLAPSGMDGFTLVVLSLESDNESRFARAIRRIRHASKNSTWDSQSNTLPFVAKKNLSYSDALLGQFELISSNAVSVFLNDTVFSGASKEYLEELYTQLLKSSEFEMVSIRVEALPPTESGNNFINQFLGSDEPWQFKLLKLPRKKARIMEHWATKIGGHVAWMGS